jgi:hypothetical protein
MWMSRQKQVVGQRLRWCTLHMYCSYSPDFFEFVEPTAKLDFFSKTLLSKVYKAYSKTYLLP